jgi:DNA-directed RNA polymerase specialized sigma24 family protein
VHNLAGASAPLTRGWNLMGTGKPDRGPSPAPEGATPRLRRRRKSQARAAPGSATREACPALADLYHAHHQSLTRLAALLTGNPGAAEKVVEDSFVALHRARKTLRPAEDSLAELRRLVVDRSRSAARYRRPAAGEPAPGPGRRGHAAGPRTEPRFENSAVVLALRALPSAQREAVVLTRYLDLSEEQAAAAMRVSENALRRHLAAARTALRGALARGGTAPPGGRTP